MDYEQETYDDYYDYVDTSHIYEQHPASYALDSVPGPLDAENNGSSYERMRQALVNYIIY
jgi:hypothetical protein